MRRLIHFTNITFEEEEALYDYDNNELIVHGDYYHDHISDYIQGYLHGLSEVYDSYDIKIISVIATPKSKYFDGCNFTIDDEDYDTDNWVCYVDDSYFDYEEAFKRLLIEHK